MRTLVFFAALSVIVGGIYGIYRVATAPSGQVYTGGDSIDPSADPIQSSADADLSWTFVWKTGQAVAVDVAEYQIDAKICGTRRYSRGSGWQAQVAPRDVCLMWGDLATQDIEGKVSFEQDMRWTHFRTSPGSPFTPNYVTTHAANVHVIAANDNIRRAVARLDEGQVVRLTGHLVDLHGREGDKEIRWETSRTRDDEGAGACEVFLVLSLRVGDVVYH